MAASLLLMASDKNKTMKPPPALFGLSEEEPPKTEPSKSSRGRKAGNNGKGPNQKKQPQRGMGVAQLESILRVQEMNQMQRSSSSAVITPLHLSPSFPTVNDSFAASPPLRYGASTNHGPLHCPPPPPCMLNGTAVIPGGSGQGPTVGTAANNAAFNVLGVGGGGYSYGFGAPAWSPLVGCPVETSRELSSMPNPYSESQPCDICFKKKRFADDNIVRGSNTRRDSSLDIWSMINGPDHFLRFAPQQCPNLPAGTTDFSTRMSTLNAYSYPNLDESVGVVAVHRKAGSTSGKILMEYEFFPGKENARGTASKELELSLVGGEAAYSSSSITAALSARALNGNADASAAASNSVDLSLKL
ncbi:protein SPOROCYTELESS-like [Neltuma alba]|uniref:protein SPOROCYTELESS-like n=1 Tax=Neltuma alba TaxID=207710 RepID=UPI0010A5093C|nr:protein SPOROCYTELESS-like [Prosopis alba]